MLGCRDLGALALLNNLEKYINDTLSNTMEVQNYHMVLKVIGCVPCTVEQTTNAFPDVPGGHMQTGT